MTQTVLVSGATGNVGREVVRELRRLGTTVRAASSNPDRARSMLASDVEVVRFVFDQPATYAAAFAGVRGLFLMRPPDITDVRRCVNPAIDASVRAGVRHVAFLSLQGVERNPFVPHYRIERHLRAVGVPYTFLRAAFFMQNLSTTHAVDLRERSEVFVPAGSGRTAFVDVRDLAAIAALVLTQPGHEYRAYELTGSQALTYGHVAAILTRVLGRRVVYANPSILRFWQRTRHRGASRSLVLVMIGLYMACRLGLAGHVTDTVARLLGREPISFEHFASDYAATWQPAAVPAGPVTSVSSAN